MANTLIRSAAQAAELEAYDRKVFDRFVRRVRRLPWKEAVREREIGHRTLFATLVHILNVREVWLVCIVPGRNRELSKLFSESGRHPSDWRGFRAYADRVWTGSAATTGRLRPRDLGRTVRAPWMPGRYTVADAYLQASYEEAHHLGEIIGALWQDDLASPAMTWIEVTRPTLRHRQTR